MRSRMRIWMLAMAAPVLAACTPFKSDMDKAPDMAMPPPPKLEGTFVSGAVSATQNGITLTGRFTWWGHVKGTNGTITLEGDFR